MKEEEKKKFLAEASKRIVEKSEEISSLLLKKCLDDNVNFFDLHYIDARAREIMQKSLDSVLYRNTVIEKAKIDFLKVILKEMKKNFEVKKIDQPLDETEIRDDRCEDSAHYLAGILTDEGIILSDLEYVKKFIEESNRSLAEHFISTYTDSLYSKMQVIISEHERRANKKLWGKEREDISFKDLDEVLKRK
jgi:hypothetical protein